MKITIHITPQDIDNGKPNCSSCPVGIALQRECPNWDIEVTESYISIGSRKPENRNELYYFSDVPDALHQFIDDFDDGKPVLPMSVDLEFRLYDPDELDDDEITEHYLEQQMNDLCGTVKHPNDESIFAYQVVSQKYKIAVHRRQVRYVETLPKHVFEEDAEYLLRVLDRHREYFEAELARRRLAAGGQPSAELNDAILREQQADDKYRDELINLALRMMATIDQRSK